MTVTDPFLFIAGATPLDFVNTEVMLRGERTDLLRDNHDLGRWMAEAGFERPRGASLAAIKELRGQLRRTFLHLAGGGTLRPSDLAPIARVLEGTRGTLKLELREGTPRVDYQPEGEPAPLFAIARSAAEFLASADLFLIKSCEGSGCILLFYDTTKSHTRRWCSMAACGNREKVAAHYKRRREE
jgi:predicted RNA-binding Zn ribbon-like protein